MNVRLVWYWIFMFFFQWSFGQIFQGMISCGPNFTQVDGDELIGYRKIGLHAGVGVKLHLGGKWYASLETLFNQKGSYKKYPNQWDDSMKLPYYNLRLNYAEVPLLIHYNDSALWGGVGFSIGRLTSIKEIERGKVVPWTWETQPYRNMDYNVIVSVMFRIKKNVFFNFRYAYSMRYIRERTFYVGSRTWTRYQYNNMLTVKLIYFFHHSSNKRLFF